MKNPLCVIILFAIATAAFGRDGFWKDQYGNLAPDTEYRRAINGFGGWLLVTSDANWRKKRATPTQTIPRFKEVKTVARGERVFVVVFFANPKLTGTRHADVTCDVDVVRPSGVSSMHKTNVMCFQGQLKRSPYKVYLSAPVIGFVGEPADPAGKWTVRISLKDNVRHIALPLQTSFILE
jgi:hypothetical protein